MKEDQKDNQVIEITQDKKKQQQSVKFLKLFRFASKENWIFMIIGSTAAILNGLTMAAFSILFGDMSDAYNVENSQADVRDQSDEISLKLFILSLISAVLSYCQFFFWMAAGDKQGITYRKKYFEALLAKHIGWHDKINPNELSSKVANECQNVQNAIGEKISTFQMTFSMFFGGVIIGFIKGWHLALIICGFIPIIGLAAYLLTYMTQTVAEKQNQGYQEASGYAEQAFAQIRSVKALCSEEFELKFYQKGIIFAKKIAEKYGFILGLSVGLIYFVMDANFGFGMFFGGVFIDKEVVNPITDKIYTLGDILAVYFSIVFAAFAIGQASPCFKSFAQGQQAAHEIFQVIDSQPEILLNDETKYKPNSLNGDIEFKNVEFSYPNKSETTILKNVNLTFEKNKKTAIVGESGSGKSTIMQLIERFYDAKSGEVLVNGKYIKDYNVKRLRQLIGYVGQEPVLFSTSIRENLLVGKDNATEEEMIKALTQANIWQFISKLREGLDFQVGIGGCKLSGGQKQRIAIARALLKNPQILLLDEATSALDRKSELKIQATLDEISKEKTTIIIAHKLQTIQNADKIIMIADGEVAEQGTHDELMKLEKKYYALIKLQLVGDQNSQENSPKAIDDNLIQPDNIKFDKQLEDQTKINQIVPLKDSSDENDNELIQQEEPEDKQQKNMEESIKKQEEIEKKKKENAQNMQSFKRLFKYNKGSYCSFGIGSLCALMNGVIFPAMAIPTIKYMIILQVPGWINQDGRDVQDFNEDFNKDNLKWMLIIVAMSAGHFIAIVVQEFIFSILAQNLTKLIRSQLYEKIIYMPIKFFDKEENNPGILSSKLSVAASKINGLTTQSFSIILQTIGALLSGIFISFLYTWEITLLSLGFLPLIVISSMIQIQWVQGFAIDSQKDYDSSSSIIQESLCNIRTVASFANEEKLVALFNHTLLKPREQAIKKANKAGIAFAFSQWIMFAMFSCIFYVGGILQDKGKIDFEKLYISIFAIMNAGFAAGQSMQFMPDVGSGLASAKEIFDIIDSNDEKNEIKDNQQQQISEQQLASIQSIEFKNVSFQYPTRDTQLFNNLNLSIGAGQSVALVGPSGCGKSTLFSLLMKFYDIQSGEILINGVNIKAIPFEKLRQLFGVVQQEPILFNGSVEYNIIYNTENVDKEAMRTAAANANALNFIEKNQFDCDGASGEESGSGFERKVGPRGSQISGGQKQRIAIARAIIKNPKVLLLDEATSALDSESERLVQESLQKLMHQKTSITIAHRLSTIKNCDQIYMFTDGQIVESGTYDSLIAQQGLFYNFAQGFE